MLSFTARGHDYTACFHAALSRCGVEVHEAKWSGRWLHANVRPGDVISLDWPSFLYYVRTSRRKTWLQLLRFLVFLLALRVRGAKIVWTAHNLYPHDGGHAELAHRVGRFIVVKVASLIGVHGQNAAALVQREFAIPTSRLVMLEHGNWISFYPNTVTREFARARLNIPQPAFVFLFIGICKPYKNLVSLVRSHQALQDDSLLWVVGQFHDQTYYAEVAAAARIAASGRTTIRDQFVQPDDLQLYLNACDGVVLPYREILTSGAAMLALSFGRPVAAPRLGVLEELVTDDCGVLYDPRSESALTTAMRALRARRFNPAAILSRARDFSWDRSAKAFADKLRDIR